MAKSMNELAHKSSLIDSVTLCGMIYDIITILISHGIVYYKQ